MSAKQHQTFTVEFSAASKHRCSVIFHRTTKGMRYMLTTRGGHKDPSRTQACCWQSNKLQKGHVITEIHLAMDSFSPGIVAHECTHAAIHRQKFMAVTDAQWEEEEICSNVGKMVDQIMELHQRIKRVLRKKK